jgi:hypothetical protein
MTLPAVRFGGGARIRRPSSQSETGTIGREHRRGIEDPELDVAEQQLHLPILRRTTRSCRSQGSLPVKPTLPTSPTSTVDEPLLPPDPFGAT